jgi:flagellar hook-associated protein 2
MVAQGLFSIGGIASGLDTDSIVNQLMQLERQPVVRLERRQQQLQSTKDAWGQLNTRLSALRIATDQLRRPDRFDAFTTVTSSNPDAVSVSRGSRPVADTQFSFSVTQLARREQAASDPAALLSGPDALLDGRALSITIGDDTHDLSALVADLGDDATFGDLVAAINDADVGVRASLIDVGEGHRFILDATAEGTALSFTTSADWMVQTQPAQDALLQQGGVTITRSSNTITDVVDGATITLNRTTDTPVTVTAARDVDGAVAAVKGFVDAVNGTLRTVADLTKYDPETRVAGPLQGQFAATQLAFDLRRAVASPVQGLTGMLGLPSSIGLSVDGDGQVVLDEAKLRQAFTDDFAGTAARFTRTGEVSDTDAATSAFGTSDTAAGTYEVEVTKAATVAHKVGGTYTPPGGSEPKNFMVRTPGGRIITVQVDTTDLTATQAAAKIQAALDAAEVTDLTVAVEGDALSLSSTGYGSAATFEVLEVETDAEGAVLLGEDGEPIVIEGGTVFGLEGASAGTDVEGTIGGLAATGVGRTLTATDGPATGLEVSTVGDITASEAEPQVFDVTFWHGIGGAMDTQLASAEGSGGTIARARASLDSQMAIYASRIEAFESRLESREVTLRRQFVALETAIARSNAQGEWLAGQINQLSAINAQGQR